MEVIMYDSYDDMVGAIAKGKERAKAAMTDEQRSLCDGEEHYALTLESEDGFRSDPLIAVTRIWSRLEFEARSMKPVANLDEYESDEAQEAIRQAFYEMDVYWGEGGSVEYGYLPGETWDAVFDPDEGDLHDRHASLMVEISELEFNTFRDLRWRFDEARYHPITLRAIARWIDKVGRRMP